MGTVGNSQLVMDKMLATAEENPYLGAEVQQSPAIQAQYSYVWKYFNKDDTNSTMKCQLCPAVLKYNKNMSAMHNHLKIKHLLPKS